jgi:serine/threonine protein kinase
MSDCINYDYGNLYEIFSEELYFSTNFTLSKIISQNFNEGSYKVLKKNDNNKFYFLKVKCNSIMNENKIKTYSTLKDINSDELMKILEIHETDKFFYLLSDFLEGITLDKINFNNDEINNQFVINILIHVLNGLDTLHKNRIIHGDLTLANIISCNNNQVKIINYDSSQYSLDGYTTLNCHIGTCGYTAPESYDLYIYSFNSDMWSLGICLYKLFANKFPYKYQLDRKYHLCNGSNFKCLDMSPIDEIKQEYPILSDIIYKLLIFNEKKRIKIHEIKCLLE